MLTKDGRDTPVERLTPENYIVPKGEEKDYHAVIEVKQFDPKTGKRLSKPRVQKFGKKIFETSVRDSLRKQGYDVLILHDPNDWLSEQKAKAAQTAKEKEKAEKERFDAAVQAAVDAKLEAAVAKALAEREKAEKSDGQGTDQETGENAGKGRKTAKKQENE